MSNTVSKQDQKDILALVGALAQKLKSIGDRDGLQELPICYTFAIRNLIQQGIEPQEYCDYIDILGFLKILENIYYEDSKKYWRLSNGKK